MKASPFIKWAGGKQAISGSIRRYFPRSSSVNTYYEPFLGGGSIFFEYAPKKATLNDLNRWLIDTYKALRDDWERVASLLEPMPNNKEDYLQIRAQDPWEMGLYERAATFIYLNKTCFRGLFRINKQGKFNVPWGAYERRYFDPNNFRAVSRVLARVELRSTDFEIGIKGITDLDFVYFDPPYHPIGGYSDFKRYTPNQFHETEHVRLASLCAELDERGIRWVASNSDTPFVRELYQDFQIYSINARREINLNSQNRNITELVITNVPVEQQCRKEDVEIEQLSLI